jgi:hypothetical protein
METPYHTLILTGEGWVLVLSLFYRQVLSELRLQCVETEAAVSGDGGGSTRRR